jgi:ketosteroid isomerase-like protein
MSGNAWRRAAIGAAAALVLVAAMISTGSADPAAKNSPEQAITRALTDWMLAFNAGDTGAVCGLFAPELRYNYRGFPERGYDQVCQVLLGSLADQSRKYAYDLTIKEIIVSGDLAAVRLVWTLTVKRPGQMSGPATYEPGLDLFRRQGDGTWKIVRYLAYEE